MAEFRYRGRVFTTEDILYIRGLIAAHPGESRRRLSQKLCEAWQWKQPNGALCDMMCRGTSSGPSLGLSQKQLHRFGEIV